MEKKWLILITLISGFGIQGARIESAFAKKNTLYVYTSIYKEYASTLKKTFEDKNPDVTIEIFQAGSEKIQAKVEAELLSKNPQADIILTSDPFWATDLAKRNLTTNSSDKLNINYFSLMVLICNKKVPPPERPQAFQDLVKADFKDQVQSGSPLESGTAFSMVAYLSKKYGWDYFKNLRKNGYSANGGNSTVIEKVESGEKKIGIVLLENALAALKRGSPIEVIYPNDGSIPIPSAQVILKASKNLIVAEKFSEFLLSLEGQKLLRLGYMYSIREDVAAPDGARPLKEVIGKSAPWTPARIAEVASQSKQIKKQFSQIVLQ